MGTTIIKRSDRAITVVRDEAELASHEPARVAHSSDSMRVTDLATDRPTRAMHRDELLGLIKDTGGFDPEIEIVTRPASGAVPALPPALIVDRPSREIVLHERPTCAIDPDELRVLVRPAVLPVYQAHRHRHAHWSLIAAVCAAAVAVLLLCCP